jgi:hypothetical protein
VVLCCVELNDKTVDALRVCAGKIMDSFFAKAKTTPHNTPYTHLCMPGAYLPYYLAALCLFLCPLT